MSDDAHRYCGGYYEAHTCGEIDALTWRAEKAEAQVQRVRSIAQHHLEAGASGRWVAQEILVTLDGDSDE